MTQGQRKTADRSHARTNSDEMAVEAVVVYLSRGPCYSSYTYEGRDSRGTRPTLGRSLYSTRFSLPRRGKGGAGRVPVGGPEKLPTPRDAQRLPFPSPRPQKVRPFSLLALRAARATSPGRSLLPSSIVRPGASAASDTRVQGRPRGEVRRRSGAPRYPGRYFKQRNTRGGRFPESIIYT